VMCYNINRVKVNKTNDINRAGGVERGGWLKKYLVSILTLLLVIAIMVGIFYFYQNYPDGIDEIRGYGYLGAFIISLIFNATVILPAGNFVVIATLGAALPSAAIVGLVGGAGAAIGEITGYVAGYSGRAIVQRRDIYVRLEYWVKRWGILAIFLLSLAPFFFDLAGIAAGVLRFPFWKFLLACLLGRTILYIVIALAGAQGWEAVLRYLG
ncbi:YqaA family protein, partial [Chloroflexota bacterium]